jgi:hypothetical protein
MKKSSKKCSDTTKANLVALDLGPKRLFVKSFLIYSMELGVVFGVVS